MWHRDLWVQSSQSLLFPKPYLGWMPATLAFTEGDPEKLRDPQKELDEFKRAMNEIRIACGERILYP